MNLFPSYKVTKGEENNEAMYIRGNKQTNRGILKPIKPR